MTSYTAAAPRQQQSGAQPQSILGTGNSGATLHDFRTTKHVNNTSSPLQLKDLMEDLWSDFQSRWIPSNLDHLASLQSEGCMP